MRHADSEDPKALPKMRDHDRPITVDGRNDAKYVRVQSIFLSLYSFLMVYYAYSGGHAIEGSRMAS